MNFSRDDVTIHPATLKDVDQISLYLYWLVNGTTNHVRSIAELRHGVNRVFADVTLGQYFVAKCRDEFAGLFLISSDFLDDSGGMRWWVRHVYVLPEYRGSDLLDEMLDFVTAHARLDANVKALELIVRQDNIRAIRAYTKRGWVPDALRMRLPEWT